MNFKLDENLPVEIIADLRLAGHQAHTVQEEGLAGASDPIELEKARVESRVLLTLDKGIANARVYVPANFAGIILFRPRTSGRGAVLTFVRRHLPVLLQADLAGHLLVVSEAGIRTR